VASFRVDDAEEAQELVDRFDGKLGILGTQKVRVEVKYSINLAVSKPHLALFK